MVQNTGPVVGPELTCDRYFQNRFAFPSEGAERCNRARIERGAEGQPQAAAAAGGLLRGAATVHNQHYTAKKGAGR